MDVSFSDANSSWTSLLVDEVHQSHNFEDEVYDYEGMMETPNGLNRQRSASLETSTSKSKPFVDTKTFEQVLQVMVQQSTALDNLRTELDHIRQEYRQELQNRDDRTKESDARIRALQADKEKADAEIESLRAECSALEASGLQRSERDTMSIKEHERILKRVEDDARGRVELAEAEKSRLALQQKRFQIEVAQLRNQIDSRTYPEEVLQALTQQLQQTVLDSCRNIVTESEYTKQALSEAQKRISDLEERVNEANETEEDAQRRYNNLETEMAELTEERELLSPEFNEVQWHLEQTKLKLESTKERDTASAQEQLDQFTEQIKELERARDEAFSTNEQLRATLEESERIRNALAKETEQTKQALGDAEKQVVDMKEKQESDLMDGEQLRELLKGAEQERDFAQSELHEANKILEASKTEREQVQKTCDDVTRDLEDAKARINELSTHAADMQQKLEKADSQLSERQTRLEKMEKSHAESMVKKASELDDAIAKSETIQKELDTVKQTLADNEGRIAQVNKEIDESRTKELSVSQALCEAKMLESRMKTEINDLQSTLNERRSGENEVNAQLDAAVKRLHELEQAKAEGEKVLQAEIKAAKEERDRLQVQLEGSTGRLEEASKLRADAEKKGEQYCKRLEEVLLQNREAQAKITKAEREIGNERQQVELLNAAIKDVSDRLKDVEAELVAAVEEKKQANKELADVNSYHKMQVSALEEQKDRAESRLKDLELLVQSSSKDQAEVRDKLEELTNIKEKAAKDEEALMIARKELSRIRNERSATQVQLSASQVEAARVQDALQEARKGRTDALRENERIRLQYAESEGSRAEVVLLNEEIEQRKTELEQEKNALEHELQNMRAQLAEVKSHLETAEQAQEHLLEEKASILTQLGKAESKCMKLEAARRQLAAVYGIPVDSPLASPDRPNPPSRVGSMTTRSSASLSPSTNSAPVQIADLVGPPSKRLKLTRSAQNWPSIESATSSSFSIPVGSSVASAISLDDVEEAVNPTQKRGKATKSKKRERKQPASTDATIPRPLFLLYESFAKSGSWKGQTGRANCGFCALENASGVSPQHSSLEFDPVLYPAQFWSHCVYYHSVALRRDLESFLKAEAQKDLAQSPADDSAEVFTKLVSWKGDNKTYVCGLCELESKHNPNYVGPKVQGSQFWQHCRSDHKPFWKPSR